MLSHVLYHAVDILEETHVAELVQLVMADSLNLQLLLDIIQVCLGSCRLPQYRNPGSVILEVEENL